MIASDPNVTASIQTFTQILEAHERSHASGAPLLTDAGICLIRRALVSVRSRLNGESVVTPFPLLPFWDGERRQLWLGTSLLKEFSQPASNQVAVLTSFRSIGWASRRIDDPLPSTPDDLPGDARLRLRQTVKNLNRGIPVGTIHFWLDGERNEVTWDFCGGTSAKDLSLASRFDLVEAR